MSQSKSASILDSRILIPAVGGAFTKLNPKTLAKNPVMFVVAVVSVLTMVEEEFGFSIDDDEMSAEVFETLGALAAFVDGKLAN